MINIAVLLSGRGSNFTSIHRAILNGLVDGRIVCVISNKADAGGLEYAKRQGIHAVFIDPENKANYNSTLEKELEQSGADLVCLAGYMKIVPKSLVDKYYGRMMNVHPSLLPAFPGLDAQKQALDYGVRLAGCTVHFVDSGMDTGPVILQTAVPVYAGDTVQSLSDRILVEEHKIYPKAVALFADGKLSLSGRQVSFKQD